MGVSDPGDRAEGLETHPPGRRHRRSSNTLHTKPTGDHTESWNHRTHRLTSILERISHLQLTWSPRLRSGEIQTMLGLFLEYKLLVLGNHSAQLELFVCSICSLTWGSEGTSEARGPTGNQGSHCSRVTGDKGFGQELSRIEGSFPWEDIHLWYLRTV